MKEKLSRIRNPYHRLIVSLFLSCLVFIGGFKGRRASIHWIGNRQRPRRLERILIIALLFVAMLFMDPHQYLLWAIAWGGAASLFVILQSARQFIPRKNYHWIKSNRGTP